VNDMRTSLAQISRLARSARVRAALSLGVVTAVGATGTFAYWTDSVAVTGTTFTSGRIDLQVNNADSVSSYTALNITNMVPGNSVAATLTVKNIGTVPLKYTGTSTATTALGGALTIRVTNGTVTGSAPAQTCTGTALTGSGTAFGGSLVGPGRQLNGSGGFETVCVQVSLPSTTTDSNLQGLTSNATFAFTGTSDLS
jgi:predicted ribosomally synthesized peptide with SipW-like signal peptide